MGRIEVLERVVQMRNETLDLLELENEQLRAQVASLKEELDEKSRRYRTEVDRLSLENDRLATELNRIKYAIKQVNKRKQKG